MGIDRPIFVFGTKLLLLTRGSEIYLPWNFRIAFGLNSNFGQTLFKFNEIWAKWPHKKN
jgi:hypothetical protein